MESSELFGDNNTRMHSTSVLLSPKKLHKIPYHMGHTWNEVVNPFLPREFISLYRTMFSGQVCAVSAHDKGELGTLNLRRDLPHG